MIIKVVDDILAVKGEIDELYEMYKNIGYDVEYSTVVSLEIKFPDGTVLVSYNPYNRCIEAE